MRIQYHTQFAVTSLAIQLIGLATYRNLTSLERKTIETFLVTR